MSGLELLPEEDRAFVTRKGWDVDVTRLESGEIQLIIRNFPLSARYAPRQVDILIRLMPGYPDTPLDMFWTRPDVILVENNQKPQNTEVKEDIRGASWQRWSRHMGAWRPGGIDNLESFFATAMRKELLS